MKKDKTERDGLTRRELMSQLLAASMLGAAGSLTGCGGPSGSGGSEGGYHPDKRMTGAQARCDLAVVKNGEPDRLVQEAFKILGGMSGFIGRQDVVVIKPNIGFNRAPEQAANTNPLVVREVARLVLEAGAKKVLIFDHSLNEPRNCYARSGITAAVQDLEVDLDFPEERKFVDVKVGGEWLKNWPLYRPVLEADKVINIPIAKQHSTARLSLGFKNLMGVIGGRRESFHQNIHTALADLSSYLRPTLTVLDAYRILTRNGPQGGSTADVEERKILAVSNNPVAVDAFGCTLFDIDPATMGFIQQAESRGLGSGRLASLNIQTVTL